ncbi:hypothetical protein [Methanolobus bombayensis]|uniref:hypothetical protein n=1 Tax=Methanolobus bombayensis TaxID=38023 RepID=UPI001AE312A1|nr:hypothetical protein [Methanolobus bombayensis]MBP1908449.1 hypothetical protein [Methanolobus bombayensis]
MLDLIQENLDLMLTGSTMALFGGIFYTATAYSFNSGGKFCSKEKALLIFLISIPLSGYITLFVEEFWQGITPQFSLLNMLGAVIIVGMSAVNNSVKNWKYTDEKSLVIYAIGVILLFTF